MDFWNNFTDDFSQIWKNSYREGAREISKKPIIFLNPLNLKVEGEKEALTEKLKVFIKETTSLDVNDPQFNEKINAYALKLSQSDPKKLEEIAEQIEAINKQNQVEFENRRAEKIRKAVGE